MKLYISHFVFSFFPLSPSLIQQRLDLSLERKEAFQQQLTTVSAQIEFQL
jgi:hypothetical protein